MSLDTKDTQENNSSADGVRAALDNRNERKSERASIGTLQQQLGQSRPLARHSTGELVKSFTAAFTEAFALPNGGKAFEVLAFDSQLSRTAASAILIYGVDKGPKETIVAVYTVLLEASALRLNPRQVTGGLNGNFEIPRVIGDVFDDQYLEAVKNTITAAGVEGRIVNAGVTSIPSEVSKDDQSTVRMVAFYVQEAIFATLLNLTDKPVSPFSITKIDTRDTRFPARIDYSVGAVESPVGLPKRTDISVTLIGAVNNQGNQASMVEQAIDLVTVGGFVDLTFVPQNNMQMTQPSLKSYQPRFVITNWDTGGNITPEMMLLGLGTATLLNDEMQWANTFRPNLNVGAKGEDLRDIGAIGYDINLTGKANSKPARIDVKAESFEHKNLIELITTTMHEHLVFSIDLEETGELSWIQNAFLEAAAGNPVANEAIIRSADQLVGGGFSEIYRDALNRYDGLSDQVCFLENLRVPLGYFKDANDSKRDIRELDLLALLNLHGSNNLILEQWSDVFDNQQMNPDQRSALYLELIGKLISAPFQHKGWAQRATFNPAFIEALNLSTRKAGLVITPNNTAKSFNTRVTRGNANVLNYSLGAINSGLFRQHGDARGAYRGFQGGSAASNANWI